MTTLKKKDVTGSASNGMKLLGIDYGSKNIGIAISDEAGEIAFPKDVLANDKDAVSLICKLVEHESVEEIVVGESRDYKGEENLIMEGIHRFKKNLKELTRIPIHFEPELLSTQEARRGQEDTKKIDASAAAIILQSYIDKQKH
jgi:putative holliday junction resolvase